MMNRIEWTAPRQDVHPHLLATAVSIEREGEAPAEPKVH